MMLHRNFKVIQEEEGYDVFQTHENKKTSKKEHKKS